MKWRKFLRNRYSNNRHIRREHKDFWNTIKTSERLLERCPDRAELLKRIVKARDIKWKSNEKPNRKRSRRDKIDAISKNNELADVRSESVAWRKYIIGKTRAHSRLKICFISDIKFLAKIIKTIESNHDFEIIDIFLDLSRKTA